MLARAVSVIPGRSVEGIGCADAAAKEGAVDEVGGSALRILHQLAVSLPAAEGIARATPPASGPLMAAMAKWGLAGSVLALETVKRALTPASRSRDLLIAALLSGGLLPLLLKKLDWHQDAAQRQDGEVQLLPSCTSSKIERHIKSLVTTLRS